MLRHALITVVLALTCGTALANPYGLTDEETAALAAQDARAEDVIRARYPSFRLKTGVDPDLPGSEKADQDTAVTIYPRSKKMLMRKGGPPAIVTLHAGDDGRPLANCQAPCTLRTSRRALSAKRSRPDFFVIYRYGSLPQTREPMDLRLTDRVVVVSSDNLIDARDTKRACDRRTAKQVASSAAHPAKPCRKPPPRLPPQTTRSGFCDIDVVIGTDGRVGDATIACNERMFCQTTRDAFANWLYSPATANGAVVESRITERIDYTLDNGRGRVFKAKGKTLQTCPKP